LLDSRNNLAELVQSKRHKLVLVAWLAAAGALGGCGMKVDAPALPPVNSDHAFLTKEQQAKAMADLAAKRDAETAQALRQIESTKR
jgi:hypothetical protein